ncbi:MAG: hypothetical protein K2G13_06335 [Muribaculaceae bacterium]|nr:hypothetical protein [Muribaculaceae bacterium]
MAAKIVDDRPDSAYILLKKIDFNSLNDDENKAVYALTHAKANMNMRRSLVTDTIIPIAVNYYKDNSDTIAYIESVIARAHHLRAIEHKDEAFSFIDSVVSTMPANIQKILNQELLSFSFSDNDFCRSLNIIERQIQLAKDNKERITFEIKKVVPLITLGRSVDAVALCDSIFALPESPLTGSDEWLYLRVNYAAALGEKRDTAAKGIEILKDAIERINGESSEILAEYYLGMTGLQLNAGNIIEADKYANLIDSLDNNSFYKDPVASACFNFLKIVLEYEQTGVLSLSRLSNTALSLRQISDDLESKQKERDNAIETSYDLSRRTYELTIERQRMWLLIVAIMLISIVLFSIIFIVAHRRRQKLIEAEERIEALEQLSKEVSISYTDDKQAFLKRTLLQQIGIIRTFAESPTTQNQEVLKKISNIGNSEFVSDALVNWKELYPAIDELYDSFHTKLINDYPGLFSDREIQILCLLRADFSTKEIGVLIRQTSNSVYVSKTAIRKKLNLPPKDDLIAFLTAENRT